MGCIESGFLYHASPTISSFTDTDLPALMLFLQYITQLEGPLWRQIRGHGFAYGYNMIPKPNEGLLFFTLYRATNVVAAFREAKQIIVNLLKHFIWFETLLNIQMFLGKSTEGGRCMGFNPLRVCKKFVDFRNYRA